MTREEIREAANVMLAYAEGKEIEGLLDNGDYSDCGIPHWDWKNNAKSYRIKSKPTYRPFKDAEECWQEMQKHAPFGWIKNNTVYRDITVFDNDGVSLETTYMSFKEIAKRYTFADGTYFGIKEEE